MSRRFIGRVLTFVVALSGLLSARPAWADDVSAAGRTVYLTVREPDGYNPAAFPAPLLERELVRQAFLLAARDELGLSTRDVILREDFPEKPDAPSTPFELFCRAGRGKKDFDVEYILHRRQEGGNQQLWQWVYNTDINNPKSLEVLAEKAEAFSRGELKDVLSRGGWGKMLAAARASADIAAETRDLLWSWNEISVLAGLRRVHAEIREKGESPELLAALLVGYANLGTLTEYYYSACCKAYYARGLLYAERLLRKTDDSPWALWHRAYVRTQVGLHNFAANDIAAAKKKQGEATPLKPLPFWTGVIDDFTQGQLAQMLKNAKTGPQRQLAHYLDVQAVAQGTLEEVRIKSTRGLIAVCPDCPRAYDVLGATRVLGPKQEGAYLPFAKTGAFLRKRLPDVPGLPESIAKRLHLAEDLADESEEIKFRKELIAKLKEAGTPARDRGEPSLSALAHMIDEINFAQVMRRLEYEAGMIGVATDQTVATFAPLCVEHPYGAYTRAFVASKTDREAAARELIARLDRPAFTFKEWTLLGWLHGVMPTAPLNDSYQIPGCHSDMIFSDEMRGIWAGNAGQPDDRKYNRPYMMKCWNTSNKLPLAVAMRITRDWAHARQQTYILERDYADDPMVMNALATRYFNLGRYDDAERCAKLQVRYAPSYPAYHLLAGVYKAKDNRAQWKETLEKALEVPAEGLEHAQIRNDIAQDFMQHMQWEEALPYAEAAAQSYSAWSMLTAARCHEMLGHWKKAEQLVRAVSERYDNSISDWMYWCHRTGHGDVAAADEFVRAKFDALGTTLEPNQYRNIGHYYHTIGDPEKAFLLYQRAYEKGHDPFTGLHAALVADSLGKTTERDELFRQVVETQLPAHAGIGADHYRHVIAQLREMLPPKEAKTPDLAAFDKLIAATANDKTSSLLPSTLPYFVGFFLKNHGDSEAAKTYLLRCAQADDWNAVNHVLACLLLRQMKVDIPAPAASQKTEAKPAKPAAAEKPKSK